MEQNRFFADIKKNFGFGAMRLPMIGDEVDIEQTKQMVDYFIENGFNYFDTAHGYIGGQSETALKAALTSRYPRDQYILTDKLSTPFFNKQEEIRPLIEKQLEACGVEYFDFLLMHAQEAAIYAKYKRCQAYETAFQLKEEGLTRHVGISFHDTPEMLDEILTTYPQIEIVQIQLNYLDYEDVSIQSRKVYEVCEKHNKPVIIMEPVKGGRLVNLPEAAQNVLDEIGTGSNASYAIRFAAGFKNICMVLSGMSSFDQMKDNVSFMKDFQPLNEKELEAVAKVAEIIRSMGMIPCTGCKYCVLDNDCPMKIQIPNLFSCFNAKKMFDDWNQDLYYNMTTSAGGKASTCIKCGKCEKICPQHLPIRKLLEDVAKTFE